MRMLLTMSLIIFPVLALAQAGGPKIKRTNPPTLSKPTGYTHVVEAAGGRTVYVSGQIALDKDGKMVGRRHESPGRRDAGEHARPGRPPRAARVHARNRSDRGRAVIVARYPAVETRTRYPDQRRVARS